MENFEFRNIEKEDYHREYLELLEQLTIVDKHKISFQNFDHFIGSLSSYHQIIVCMEKSTNKIIGTGTILIEKKIIHGMTNVGHIEDLVVNRNYRGKNIAKNILDGLIELAIKNKCYKIILNCCDDLEKFYQKVGFEKRGLEMSYYLDK